VLKWLKVDQDNVRIKFLVLNVDFSSLCPDLLLLTRPAYASINVIIFPIFVCPA